MSMPAELVEELRTLADALERAGYEPAALLAAARYIERARGMPTLPARDKPASPAS